jgi:hypothetical protein
MMFRLIAFPERFSPWGYPIDANTPTLPLEGDFHDAEPA